MASQAAAEVARTREEARLGQDKIVEDSGIPPEMDMLVDGGDPAGPVSMTPPPNKKHKETFMAGTPIKTSNGMGAKT